MKKILIMLIICISLALTLVILLMSQNTINLDKLISMNLYKYNSTSSIFIEELALDETRVFAQAITDKGDLIETIKDIEEFHGYVLEFLVGKENTKNNRFKKFQLYIDDKNLEAYSCLYGKEEKIYEVKTEYVKEILSQGELYQQYKEQYQQVPNIDIFIDDEKVKNISFNGDWHRVLPVGDMILVETLSNNSNGEGFTFKPGQIISVQGDDNSPMDSSTIVITNKASGDVITKKDSNIEIPNHEGIIDIKITCIWDEKKTISFGKSENIISGFIDLEPKVTINDNKVLPGDVLILDLMYANGNEKLNIETNINTKIVFYDDNEKKIALVPINTWQKPGEYYIDIEDENGRKNLEKKIIEILPDNFIKTNQEVVVSKEVAQKGTVEATNHDAEIVAKAKSDSANRYLFSGKFMMPLEGRISTPFAQTRYSNWSNPYRHLGIDIAANYDVPIKASNSGVVVYSGELIRSGNTVIIDHGADLFTSYLHMNKLNVEIGDTVNKGDIIGLVGSTGVSTGPHLHWASTLNGVYINPAWLVENNIFMDFNR